MQLPIKFKLNPKKFDWVPTKDLETVFTASSCVKEPHMINVDWDEGHRTDFSVGDMKENIEGGWWLEVKDADQ